VRIKGIMTTRDVVRGVIEGEVEKYRRNSGSGTEL